MSGGDRRITNPEKALWQEVLWLAVDEALHGPKHVERQHFARMCREARDYITKLSRDLAMICALAGVDMDAVIDRMRSNLTPARAPEELATVPRKGVSATLIAA